MLSRKNTAMFGQASMDIGLGDQLRDQTQDTIEEQKKKKMLQGQGAFGPATQSLFSMAGSFNARI